MKQIYVLILGLLVTLSCYAKDEEENAVVESLCRVGLRSPAAAEIASSLLGKTLTRYVSPSDFTFDLANGLGPRRFFGTFPPRTIESTAVALSQGAFWWGYSLRVVNSVEEARQHEKEAMAFYRKLDGSASEGKDYSAVKIGYIIGNFDPELIAKMTARDAEIKQMPATTEEEKAAQKAARDELDQLAAATLKKGWATARLFQFRPLYVNDDGLTPTPDASHPVEEIDKEDFALRTNLDEFIWSNPDPRGPRFHVYGWGIPAPRGLVHLPTLLKLDSNGSIENPEIRRSLRAIAEFVKDGGTVSLNTNFPEALAFAINQWRSQGRDEFGYPKPMAQASRYKSDGNAEKAMMLSYQAGQAHSLEIRDKTGRLVAGGISTRSENMITGDTVFHLQRLSDDKTLMRDKLMPTHAAEWRAVELSVDQIEKITAKARRQGRMEELDVILKNERQKAQRGVIDAVVEKELEKLSPAELARLREQGHAEEKTREYFYNPEHPDMNYAEISRGGGLLESARLLTVGIEYMDVGMVTAYTQQGGGRAVSWPRFVEVRGIVNSRPTVDLMFGRNIELSEFGIADIVRATAATPPPPPKERSTRDNSDEARAARRAAYEQRVGKSK